MSDVVEPAPADLVPRADVPARWPAISARLIRRLTEERVIPPWVIGRRVWVSARDVAEYVAGCRRPATRETM